MLPTHSFQLKIWIKALFSRDWDKIQKIILSQSDGPHNNCLLKWLIGYFPNFLFLSQIALVWTFLSQVAHWFGSFALDECPKHTKNTFLKEIVAASCLYLCGTLCFGCWYECLVPMKGCTSCLNSRSASWYHLDTVANSRSYTVVPNGTASIRQILLNSTELVRWHSWKLYFNWSIFCLPRTTAVNECRETLNHQRQWPYFGS